MWRDPADGGSCGWVDGFLYSSYWKEVEASKFDPVAAGRVFGDNRERANFVLGFEEAGELVLLPFLSWDFGGVLFLVPATGAFIDGDTGTLHKGGLNNFGVHSQKMEVVLPRKRSEEVDLC